MNSTHRSAPRPRRHRIEPAPRHPAIFPLSDEAHNEYRPERRLGREQRAGEGHALDAADQDPERLAHVRVRAGLLVESHLEVDLCHGDPGCAGEFGYGGRAADFPVAVELAGGEQVGYGGVAF